MEPQAGRVRLCLAGPRDLGSLPTHDIQVVLGTPTASPPPWLMCQASRCLSACARMGGARPSATVASTAPTHPAYHGYSRRIVTQMAQHYAAHPSVIGWQIDNEFGDRCYCPVCAQAAFQAWLQPALRDPRRAQRAVGDHLLEPSLHRLAADPRARCDRQSRRTRGLPSITAASCPTPTWPVQQSQIDILREQCPQHLITHNLMGFKYDRSRLLRPGPLPGRRDLGQLPAHRSGPCRPRWSPAVQPSPPTPCAGSRARTSG